jgi:hypothetical protein
MQFIHIYRDIGVNVWPTGVTIYDISHSLFTVTEVNHLGQNTNESREIVVIKIPNFKLYMGSYFPPTWITLNIESKAIDKEAPRNSISNH